MLSITASPSRAVVSEIAPMWITASSLRPSSQREEVPRRHDVGEPALLQVAPLAVAAEQVVDGDVARPASSRLATTFDPMKPAPPVTNNIRRRSLAPQGPPHLCPRPGAGATERRGRGERQGAAGRHAGQRRPGRLRQRKRLQLRDKNTSAGRTDQMNDSSNNEEGRAERADGRPILIVPYMWIGDFVRCHSVVRLLQRPVPGQPDRRADHHDGAPPCSTTCPGCARASSGTCRAGASPSPSIGRWPHGCAPKAMAAPW